VDLTIVHPNPVAGMPLRGSAATFLKDKGGRIVRRAPDPVGGWAWTSPPWCSTPGGGLHAAGKVVERAMFARCTAPLLPSARPASVSALRQGLSVQMGRSVDRKLEALMMVSMDIPAWWSAALPSTPDSSAAGNPRW